MIEALPFVVLVNREMVAAQVRVSLAHVVVIVAHVSANDTFAELASVVLGFAALVIAILSVALLADGHSTWLVLIPISEVLNHLLLFE